MTELIKPTRRGFLGLAMSALAAPVIVKAASIMPVKAVPVVAPTWRMIPTEEVTAVMCPEWVRQFRIELFERAAAMTGTPDAYLGARLSA